MTAETTKSDLKIKMEKFADLKTRKKKEQEVIDQISQYISEYFYYVEYPERKSEGFWTDKNGKKQSIMSMNEEEIHSCLKRIDLDIGRFDGVLLNDLQDTALSEILPRANVLKNELREELELRAMEELEMQDQETIELQLEKELQELKKQEFIRQKQEQQAKEEKQKQEKEQKRKQEKEIQRKKNIELEKRKKEELDLREKELDLREKELALKEKELEMKVRTLKTAKPSAPSHHTKDRIKNPVNFESSVDALLGFVKITLSYDWPRETTVKYIKLIQRTANRMKNELGDISKKK